MSSPTKSVVLTILFSLSGLQTLHCHATHEICSPSSCGNISTISYPFRLKDDPPQCGDPLYELECQSNQTILYLNLSRRHGLELKFPVREISYERQQIWVIDPGLWQDDCSMQQHSSLGRGAFSYGDPYLMPFTKYNILIIRCPFKYVDSTAYAPGSVCKKNSSYQEYMYAITDPTMPISEVHPYCPIVATVPTEYTTFKNWSYIELRRELLRGIKLSWKEPLLCRDCHTEGKTCMEDYLARFGTDHIISSHHCFSIRRPSFWECTRIGLAMAALVQAGKFVVGILIAAVVIVYRLWTKEKWMDSTVADFLTAYRGQAPTRYSYSEVKKMTKGFKEKLGQGGYGSVFKGKLKSGRLVAVKMLLKSEGDGTQDFISEVATIGRIHHVNVVHLVGFCSEGSKRALIYDFMSNGSLEKHIFSPEKSKLLSCDEIYKIALGIGRGIQYLHQGCDMRILHFDIKPHNILLDQNFTPKISDFGLAKLYPTDESIVYVTAARGTLGYMAPELFYKNIGKVSYKSDVYSYGMMLMEMAGRRKNFNEVAEKSSQVYFPQWAYEQMMDQGGDLAIEGATEDECKMVKKMVTVALWCIQMRPIDRPSMDTVIEMLEGNGVVQMPPTKPFLCSFGSMPFDNNTNIDDCTLSYSSVDLESTLVDKS